MQSALKSLACAARLFAGRILGSAAIAAALFGTIASAQATPPSIVVSQTTWLAPFSSGRVLSSANPAGSSFAVNSNGDVLVDNTYGNQVMLISSQTGAVTVLGQFQNVGAVTIDPQNNLYVAGLYTGYIIKLPYINGSYAPLTTDPQATLPTACTGNDTAECSWGANVHYSGNDYWFGVVSMAFDAAGNFYFATNNTGGTSTPTTPDPHNPYSIFACNAACVSTANTNVGTNLPTLLYTEPLPFPSTVTDNAEGIDCATNGSTVQIIPGALTVDSWGNLFFTDSALDSCGSTGGQVIQSDFSSLKEIPAAGGTPNTLYTLTPVPPFAYNDEVDAVTSDPNGTIYFGLQDSGIYAFHNNGTPFTGQPTGIYGITPQGTKVLALDSKGNAYAVASLQQGSTSTYLDTLGRVSINNVTVPASAVQAASNTTSPSVNVMENILDCSSTPAFTFTATENGASTSEFNGAVSGACQPDMFNGSSYPATIGAAPAYVGERSAVLTVKDSSGNTGTAIASITGKGSLLTLDPGQPPASLPGFSGPAGIAVNSSGTIFVANTAAHNVDKVSGSAVTAIGSGFASPVGVALDANGNLYVSDTSNNDIIEISNPDGAATQTTLIASSVNFAGTPLNGPTGLAIGPDGVLYIADTGNNRVVTYNPLSGIPGIRLTGLTSPIGIAVDSSNSLYVAAIGTGSSGASVQRYSGSNVTAAMPSSVTEPAGIAVEPSGSILIADAATGNIVRVPNESGTLTPADAEVVEKNSESAAGLALDVAGNLYTTDTLGNVLNIIQRTASAVDFGTYNDGTSSLATTIYAENAGNVALAQAAGAGSFLAPPSSPAFILASGSPLDCTTSANLAVGAACEFTVQFSPALGTPAGTINSTAYFNSIALNAPSAPIYLSGTAAYVAPPVAAAPTFTPAAGTYTTPQAVTITDATAGALIYYTTDGSTPSTSSKLYSSAIALSTSGTTTINAIAIATGYSNSSVASATYTINLSVPSFTIAVSQSSQSVKYGSSVTNTVTVTPQNGFNSAVTFSCSGVPDGLPCTFSPSTVTPSSSTPSTTQLTIGSAPTSALNRQTSPFLPGTALACAIGCFFGFRKRRKLQIMLLLAIGVIGTGTITGCGTTVNPITSTVTVTATSGSMQSTATFSLTVTQK